MNSRSDPASSPDQWAWEGGAPKAGWRFPPTLALKPEHLLTGAPERNARGLRVFFMDVISMRFGSRSPGLWLRILRRALRAVTRDGDRDHFSTGNFLLEDGRILLADPCT